MKNSEKQNLPENKKRFSWWRKVLTTIALAWTLSACDKAPNDQIILNRDKESVTVSFEYQFGWAESGTTVDFNVFVNKNGDKYEWTIEKTSDWMWIFSDVTHIESDNIDWLFEEISKKSDSEDITDKTRTRKEAKLDFAKQAFKDSILNNKNPWKGEVRMKYKPKK